MASRAQEQLATFLGWLEASDAPRKAPLSGTVYYGPTAVVLPQSLELPPDARGLGPDHVPIWCPAAQALRPPPFPANPASAPANQGRAAVRLRSIVWKVETGELHAALVPLIDPAEPLQAALDRSLPGLDLEAHAALFLPSWLFGEETLHEQTDVLLRDWAAPRLPLVSG